MLFQTDIEAINAEIAQLEELIKAKLQHQNQLQYLQNLAGEAVKSLQNVVTQISNPDERKALQKAVVSLFDSLDNSNEVSPTLPTAPVPAPVITATPAPAGTVVAAPLPEVDSEPESGSEEVAEKEVLETTIESDTPKLETELIQVTSFVSYLKGTDRAIECTYVGFNNKSKAQTWGEWLTQSTVAIASKFEVKPAIHLPFKYELWVWGLNRNQVNQLAEQDFSKIPKVESAKASLVHTPQPAHTQVDEVEPGDSVCSLLTPAWTYKVKEVKPNGTLMCERTLGEQTFTVEKNVRDIRLVEKAKDLHPDAPPAQSAEEPQVENQLKTDFTLGESPEPTVEETPTKVAPKLEDVEQNDLVGSLLVPGWTYRVLEVKPNGQLNCERLLASGQSFKVDLNLSGVYLIEKATKEATKPEPNPELLAGSPSDTTNSPAGSQTEPPESEPATQPEEPMTPLWLANSIRSAWSWEEIKAVIAGNELHKRAAWKLLTPEEQNRVKALKTESVARREGTPKTNSAAAAQATVDDFQQGDQVEVTSTRHGEDRLGEIGIVKVVNDQGLTVEGNGNLTDWYPEELRLIGRS